MTELSNTTYGIPVVSFTNTDTAVNTNPGSSDNTVTVIVTAYDTGQTVTAIHTVDDHQSRYQFRVIDAATGVCEYSGEDLSTVPIPVIRAVYEAGYGVDGSPGFDILVSAWTIITESLNAIQDSYSRSDTTFTWAVTRQTDHYFQVLNRVLLTRSGTTSSEFETLCKKLCESEFGITDLDVVEETLFNSGITVKLPQPLRDAGKNYAPLSVVESSALYELNNSEFIAVNTHTKFGVECFRFERTSDSSCSYLRASGRQSALPNYEACKFITQEMGYSIDNIPILFEWDTRIGVAKATVDIIDYLLSLTWEIGKYSKRVLRNVFYALRRLASVWLLSLTVEEDVPDAYHGIVKEMLDSINHPNTSGDELSEVAYQRLAKLVLLSITELPSEAVEKTYNIRGKMQRLDEYIDYQLESGEDATFALTPTLNP